MCVSVCVSVSVSVCVSVCVCLVQQLVSPVGLLGESLHGEGHGPSQRTGHMDLPQVGQGESESRRVKKGERG